MDNEPEPLALREMLHQSLFSGPAGSLLLGAIPVYDLV